MSIPIKFVNGELEEQWDEGEGHGVKLHPKLVQLVSDFCQYAFSAHGWIPTVTSIVRTPEHDKELGGSGVHTVGRALDIATNGVSAATVSDCKAYVDKLWRYDKMRPKMTVCYIKPHGTGPHAHLQVHVSSVRSEGV